MTTKAIDVEIWSDVVCPWCYIGTRRFRAGLDAFLADHPDVEVRVAYRAFLLDPTAPVGPGAPVVDVYEKKFGGADQAAAIIERVTAEAEGEGLEFRLDIAKRANTILAHRLLALGEHRGRQAEVKEALLRAYFSEGREIGDAETLVDLAAEAGLDRDETEAWLAGDGGRAEVADHLEFAAGAGITSVPTFVFDRSFGVAGAQAPEVFTRALEQAMS